MKKKKNFNFKLKIDSKKNLKKIFFNFISFKRKSLSLLCH